MMIYGNMFIRWFSLATCVPCDPTYAVWSQKILSLGYRYGIVVFNVPLDTL